MKAKEFFSRFSDSVQRQQVIFMAWEGYGQRSKVFSLFTFSAGVVCLIGFMLASYLWFLAIIGGVLCIAGVILYQYIQWQDKADQMLQKAGNAFLHSVYQEIYEKSGDLARMKIKKSMSKIDFKEKKIIFQKQSMSVKPTSLQAAGMGRIGGFGRFVRPTFKRPKLISTIAFYNTGESVIIVPKEAVFLKELDISGEERSLAKAKEMNKYLPQIDLFSSILRYAYKENANEIFLLEFHELSRVELFYADIVLVEFDELKQEYGLQISNRDGKTFLINANAEVAKWIKQAKHEQRFPQKKIKQRSNIQLEPFDLAMENETTLGTGKLCPMCSEIVKAGAQKCRYCGYKFY